MLKVGIIADTHGHLDPTIQAIFQSVNHILHAGDIGFPWLILELEAIAPVTAVKGNCDAGLEFRETEITILGDRKFIVHHIVDPSSPVEKVKRLIVRENPDVVVFGHTHRRCCNQIGQTLYFNPGYAGKRRFNLPRSVAILNCDDRGITADYFELP